VASGILDVDNVKGSLVLLLVDDGTDTTGVMTTGDHAEGADIELDEITDLSGLKVEHDGIIHSNVRIRVADSAAIVGGDVRDTALAELNALNLAELVGRLLLADAVDNKATLGVVEEAEVLISLGNVNDIHETNGVGLVSADLAVDVDQAVHEDGDNLLAGQSILQAVSEEKDEGQALASLVGTGRWLRGKDTRKLVKKPVLGGIQPLQMLLRATHHLTRAT